MLAHTLAAIALLATSIVAQGTQGLPSCATSCITNYGGCNQVDVKCICTNQDLLAQLSCCVSQKCTADEITQVVQFADTLCGSYGVSTLPQAASCSAGASTAASSGTASSTGTASAGGSTSPASASASATSSATGTAASASATGESTASSASESASAAATETGSSAIKSYKAEGMGIGMAILGLLAAF